MTTSLPPPVHQVLRLAADGLGRREIAQRLDMPVADVERCLHDAVAGLRAASLLQAVVKAEQFGLIAPRDSIDRPRQW